MRSLALLALLPFTAAPDVEPAQVVPIALSSFKFTPATVTLEHGHPYVLRLTNTSKGGHDFAAKAFFTAAGMTAADRAVLHDGAVEVGGGDTADVRLTAPAPGHYPLRCSHLMHAAFGMKGEIVVR